MTKYKNIICLALVAVVFAGMTVAAWVAPTRDFSDSERRELAKFPTLSISTLLDGTFMSKFESYTQDQFPFRDTMRTIKAMAVYYMFGQSDNNGIYIKDGYAAKLEYPLNEDKLDHAASRFEYVYNKFIKNKNANVYLSIVPDKSYYLADEGGYLAMDYEKLFTTMREKMDFATYIDITGTLDITDYYKTDTHWRQEKLTDTAATIAGAMGATLSGEYKQNTLDNPFYGVYYGQASLPMQAETIYYLTNDTLDNFIVTNMEDGTVGGIYNMDKATGRDPYEMFLSGSVSLLTIENPDATTDRELVIFRDSFGSSISPLLAEGYAKVTLVDIRYLLPDYVGRFVNFENCDVLFLYSTLVLNNSETIQ